MRPIQKPRESFGGKVMLILGASYVVLGITFWSHDHAALDLLLVGVCGFVLLIGAGFYWVVPRMTHPLPKSPS